MGRLLGGYARSFNRRHGRVGHVFQGRFRSKLVLRNSYLVELARYIHMNPVKAELVPRPEDYPWCSFGSYFGRRSSVPVARETLKQRFPGPGGPKDFYAFTVARRIPDASETGWPNCPQWYATEPSGASGEAPQAGRPSSRKLLKEVAERFGYSTDRLIQGWRDPRLGPARAAAMLALRDQAGLSRREIADILGLRCARSVCNRIGAGHS